MKRREAQHHRLQSPLRPRSSFQPHARRRQRLPCRRRRSRHLVPSRGSQKTVPIARYRCRQLATRKHDRCRGCSRCVVCQWRRCESCLSRYSNCGSCLTSRHSRLHRCPRVAALHLAVAGVGPQHFTLGRNLCEDTGTVIDSKGFNGYFIFFSIQIRNEIAWTAAIESSSEMAFPSESDTTPFKPSLLPPVSVKPHTISPSPLTLIE